MIATTIFDAYDLVDPAVALPSEDPRYVDFQAARGENDDIFAMMRRIERTRNSFVCQLFTGHRGCGKTTELFRLKRELEKKNFCVVYFDVEQTLDISDLDYPDVLLTIAEQLDAQLRSTARVALTPQLLRDVAAWFADMTQTEVQTTADLQTVEGEIGVENPWFARFLAKIRGEVKNSTERRTEIREQFERRAAELIERVNALIDDAQIQLRRAGKRGLVLLIDGLEKIIYRVLDAESGLNSHNLLFIHHGEQLRSPRCHLVYTYPINLMFDQNIGQIFTQNTILAMVKINEHDGSACEIGRQYLRDSLAKRLDIAAIFREPDSIDLLIEASGGHLRDFFRLVRYALDFSEEVVERAQVERAIKKLAQEYDYLVKSEDLPRLQKIANTKQLPGDAAHALLLYKLLVLEYLNGERWADVHPVLRQLPKFNVPAVL